MRLSFSSGWRRPLLITVAAIAMLLALTTLAFLAVSPRLTAYVDGPEFRAMLDRQTSRGLHFDGRYKSVRRTGLLSVESPAFHATGGVKAMKSLDATGITGTFNPWGVLLRRWQLDRVHIDRGRVEVQTYEPKLDPKKAKPWFAIFLPDRVYLREVVCDTADVTWRLRGESAGIFGTRLRITPYGRDFEYQANGGELRTDGLAPRMEVESIHLLITKTILEVHDLALAPRGGGRIRITGEAGMRDDKHVDAALDFVDLNLASWLPPDWARGVRGRLTGAAKWRAAAQTIEAAEGEATLRIEGAELIDLPLLDYLAAATRRRSLETIVLSRCSAEASWKSGRIELSAIDVGSDGKFALRGALSLDGGRLGGMLELGIAPRYLDWLPRAREDIFTRDEGGLLWTKVRLSGTPTEPETDLGPRLARALRKDPAAAAGLFFRGIGEWFEQRSRPR